MKILQSFAILAIFMVTAFNTLQAQDIIVKADGVLLKGKVEEITETSIKYRKAENPSGPLYNVNKSEVLTINYENGTIDVINQQDGSNVGSVFPNRPQRANNAQTYRSSFSIGYSRLNQTIGGESGGLNGLSIEYESFVRESIGIRVPVYLHFKDGLRAVSGSVNPKFYLNDSPYFRIFAGPELGGGYVPTDNSFGFVQFLGSIGISYNVTSTFNISAYTGFGYGLAFDDSASKGFFLNNIGFKMGVNF